MFIEPLAEAGRYVARKNSCTGVPRASTVMLEARRGRRQPLSARNRYQNRYRRLGRFLDPGPASYSGDAGLRSPASDDGHTPQRPDTGLKAPPALGGSAMVARPTRRQIFAVN